MTRVRAVSVGVITSWSSCPGTASIFCANSGTQKEWMTSLAVMWSLTLRSTGSRSCEPHVAVLRVLELPRELLREHVHAHAVVVGAVVLASTIALTIAITVTSTVGITVQTISRPVCPCTGGPSESSSGRDAELDHGIDGARPATIAKTPSRSRCQPEDEVDALGLLRRLVRASTARRSRRREIAPATTR